MWRGKAPIPPRTTGELCCLRLGELNAVCKEEQAGGLAGGAGRLGFLSEGATLPTTTRQGKKGCFFLSLRSFIYERYYLL